MALKAVSLHDLFVVLCGVLVDDDELVRRRALRAAVGAQPAGDAAMLLSAALVAVDGGKRHSPVKQALDTR
eukprot:3829373-Pleurochrysis_carterae.AAC.1